MGFLNNAIAQTRDLFLSMTPSARIVAGLLLAVVLVSVGFLFQHSASGPDEYLFGGEYLSQSELTRVEAAIAVRKLSGYQRDGNRIRVPAAQKEEYLAAVAEADALPRSFHDLMQKSMEAGSVFETREDARHRRQVAHAQTISEIIRKMSWVEDAVVLVDEQTPTGLNRKRQVTGSVTVQPMPGEALTPERVKAIENLMVHSVAGLSADNVAVTSWGDDLTYGIDGLSPHMFENDYLRARMMFNEYKRREILRLLSKIIPGVGVEVNAELENISEQIERSVKPEEKTAQVREIASSDSVERTSTDPAGRPGLDAQGPYRDAATLAQQQTDRTKSTTRDNQYFAGYADQQVRKAGYMPTAVHATVAVPRSYVADIWRQRNRQAGQPDRAPEPADLAQIESDVRTQVENLINEILPGTLVGENKYKYVTVEFVDSIERPEIPPPTLTENALAWTGRNWGSLTMVGLAAFSLLVLRSMVNSSPERTGGPTLAVETGAGDRRPGAEQEEDEGPPTPRLRLKKEDSLQEDLVAMVREDPDAAATILRNWISNAA